MVFETTRGCEAAKSAVNFALFDKEKKGSFIVHLMCAYIRNIMGLFVLNIMMRHTHIVGIKHHLSFL